MQELLRPNLVSKFTSSNRASLTREFSFSHAPTDESDRWLLFSTLSSLFDIVWASELGLHDFAVPLATNFRPPPFQSLYWLYDRFVDTKRGKNTMLWNNPRPSLNGDFGTPVEYASGISEIYRTALDPGSLRLDEGGNSRPVELIKEMRMWDEIVARLGWLLAGSRDRRVRKQKLMRIRK